MNGDGVNESDAKNEKCQRKFSSKKCRTATQPHKHTSTRSHTFTIILYNEYEHIHKRDANEREIGLKKNEQKCEKMVRQHDKNCRYTHKHRQAAIDRIGKK